MSDSFTENQEEPILEEQKAISVEHSYDLSENSILSLDSETIVRSSPDGREIFDTD